MVKLTVVKQLSISTGLYKPARTLYRLLNKSQLAKFHQELEFYSKLIEPGSLCFDVGANIGEKTEVFLKIGASVVAFEPQPDCMKELKARCGHYRKKLCMCQSAVGEESGEAVLHLRESSGQASLLSNWQGKPKNNISVPVTTLDRAIVEFGKPDYCKIDVEGYELNVLKGLTQAIPLLSFEYHLTECEIETTRACLNYLSKFGELLINLTPSSILVFTFQDWMTIDQFLKVFPDGLRNREGYFYGDIFVRIT